jgi:hypothetical protein
MFVTMPPLLIRRPVRIRRLGVMTWISMSIGEVRVFRPSMWEGVSIVPPRTKPVVNFVGVSIVCSRTEPVVSFNHLTELVFNHIVVLGNHRAVLLGGILRTTAPGCCNGSSFGRRITNNRREGWILGHGSRGTGLDTLCVMPRMFSAHTLSYGDLLAILNLTSFGYRTVRLAFASSDGYVGATFVLAFLAGWAVMINDAKDK